MSHIALLAVVAALIALGAGVYLKRTTTASSDTDKADAGDAMMQDKKDAGTPGEDGTMMDDGSVDAMMKNDAMKENGDAMMEKDGGAMMEGDAMKGDGGAMMGSEAMEHFTGTVIAGSDSPLLEFNSADYEAALASDRLVMLYFFADWCPLCREEFKQTRRAFDEHTGADLVGFRAHYKDSQVTPETEELARAFGVSSQHTKVFIKNGVRILKSPEVWDAARYTDEFARALAQ